MDSLINIVGLLGLGSVIGIVVQYFVNRKAVKYEKILEVKLALFQKVYRQIYFVYTLSYEDLNELGKSSGIRIIDTCEASGLSIKAELGDILFYVDGELKKYIESLIYTIYNENAIFGKSDLEKMKLIMNELQKFIK
jgi:hypothetical protein